MSLLIDSKKTYSISTFALGVLIFGIVMNRIPLSCLAETCSISMSSANLIVLAASPFLPGQFYLWQVCTEHHIFLIPLQSAFPYPEFFLWRPP